MQKLCIAIHPDDYSVSPDKIDAASPRWMAALQEAGHQVRWIDVRRPDILEQLKGCHGFMWRWNHSRGMSRIARRLLPVIERELKLPIYPDQKTCWHYDDKIAQYYLLKSLNLPVPETWVWFDRISALSWAETTRYPTVLKLATGAGSSNVVLARSPHEARQWIERLFSRRLTSLDVGQFALVPWEKRLRAAVRYIVKGRRDVFSDDGYEPQSGYVLFQEFLKNNAFDTRVTVIGKRAFAFRRYNRPNDFRASGSGDFSVTPDAIDERMIRLAFQVATRIMSQSCAIDGLYRGEEPLIGEISYTYVSWAVHECPGHWELVGDPLTGSLRWHPGNMWPEEAQIEDFLARLHSFWKMNDQLANQETRVECE